MEHGYDDYVSAMDLAGNAHSGQFRKDGITPYITHPLWVAQQLKHKSHTLACIALLHDVLEDTSVSEEEIKKFGERIYSAVKALTNKGVDYGAYIEEVLKNPDAVEVKIMDILHNLSENPNLDKVQIKLGALGRLIEQREFNRKQ